MVATADIGRGDHVITIPFRVALVLGPDDEPPFDGCSWHIALAAKLLREKAKGPRSFFSPWLRLLPQHIPVPWLALEPGQYTELQHWPTVRRLEALAAHLRESHERSLEGGGLGGATLRELGWAVLMVCTHHFTLEMPDGEGPKHLFLPFGDLIRHRQATGEEDLGDVFWEEGVFSDKVELRTVRDIRQGQEVFEAYQNLPDEDLFLFQGVVPEDNPRNTVVVFESLEEGVSWLLAHMGGALGCFNGSRPDPWRLSRSLAVARAASAAAMQELYDREYNAGLLDGGGAEEEEEEEGFFVWDEDAHSGVEWYEGDRALEWSGKAIQVGRGWAHAERVLAAFAALWRSLSAGSSCRTGGGGGAAAVNDADGAAAFAAEALRQRCREVLQAFPTTAEEDEALLRAWGEGGALPSQGCAAGSDRTCRWDANQGEGLQLAVRFRLQQKKLLEELVGTSLSGS